MFSNFDSVGKLTPCLRYKLHLALGFSTNFQLVITILPTRYQLKCFVLLQWELVKTDIQHYLQWFYYYFGDSIIACEPLVLNTLSVLREPPGAHHAPGGEVERSQTLERRQPPEHYRILSNEMISFQNTLIANYFLFKLRWVFWFKTLWLRWVLRRTIS